MLNPFSEISDDDTEDSELVEMAKGGNHLRVEAGHVDVGNRVIQKLI